MISREKKRKFLLYIVPPLAYVVLWILYLCTRHRFYISPDIEKQNFVGCFWHGEFLMLPFLYRQLVKRMSKERNKAFFIISSQHFDGEIMVHLYRYFGLKTLRGSTSKGGLRVLIESIKLLKEGCDMGITPDGPKGPYHSIADGVVAMSQKAQRCIVPMRVECSRYWELNTWDKFKIPKPFSTIYFYADDGFIIDTHTSIEEAKQQVLQKMEKEH